MLDEKQKEIVYSNEPKIIVEAGAGSGKTRVLIERIKRLLNDGVSPENIIAITFTKMAAEEMRERLIDVEGSGDIFVGTIHAFANKIYKNSNETYQLFSEEIQDQFMNVLISLYAKNLRIEGYNRYKDLLKKANKGKIEEESIQSYFNAGEWFELKLFLDGDPMIDYPETIKTLCKKNHVITFDELLEKTTKYFKEIGGKVEYLFVDEFQDIGPLEKKFFKALNADNYFYVRRRETGNLWL